MKRLHIKLFRAATCDGGESQRYRTIEIAPSGPGVADCPGTTETKDCSLQVCLVLAQPSSEACNHTIHSSKSDNDGDDDDDNNGDKPHK